MAGTFFVAANALIENEGKLLLMKRADDYDFEGGYWEAVSGRLEQKIGSVKEEMLREVREELGDNFKVEIIAPIGTYNFFRNKDGTGETIGIDFVCKYIGGEIKINEEHSDYKWVSKDEIKNYKVSDSLYKKIELFFEVKDWFLENKHLFKKQK